LAIWYRASRGIPATDEMDQRRTSSWQGGDCGSVGAFSYCLWPSAPASPPRKSAPGTRRHARGMGSTPALTPLLRVSRRKTWPGVTGLLRRLRIGAGAGPGDRTGLRLWRGVILGGALGEAGSPLEDQRPPAILIQSEMRCTTIVSMP